MENSEDILIRTDAIVDRHGTLPGSVIPILQDIQKEFNYLPARALERIVANTGISAATLEGISTFYPQFRHKPAGRHRISVCTGTACHVKGAHFVFDAFRRALKLEGDSDTDATMSFTLEKVACLGCCTLAPAVRIDDVTFGHVTPEKVPEVLRDFSEKKRIPPAGKETGQGSPAQGEIRIGLGSCCVASGSAEVKEQLERTLKESRIPVDVKQVGCVGVCHQVPLLEIVRPGLQSVLYSRIRPEEVHDVVLSHFSPDDRLARFRRTINSLVDRMLHSGAPVSYSRYDGTRRDNPISVFLGPQIHIATENRGQTDPLDLSAYRSAGGFSALERCHREMTPDRVIDEITASGLRGRGGAGFPTGVKWRRVQDNRNTGRTVICNGDEGDPGAFMDRMLLESYPFRVIEGLMIAAYATGADQGIFYIRAEYPLAVERIEKALEICREQGLIGTATKGPDRRIDIRVFGGAGAFVCGEETALIASMEGKRGMPRLRPPYPSQSGFQGGPTLVNNTETLALVPWIIRNGSAAFASIGTPVSPGTKVFALAGKVKRGGLIEVPMGMTLRRIIEEIGGGMSGGRPFKAVQIGGPSGGCLPASLADLPVDYEALKKAGTMMGSGGMIVLDADDCMVDMARYFLSFTQGQSCGRCTFCRIGTRRMLDLLDLIIAGKGSPDSLKELERLSLSTARGSICGLGRSAPNPVLSTLRYFREEYEAHLQGRCPAGKCLPLVTYEVTETCIGCTLCAQHCPVRAIAFKPFERHRIEQETCIKCDICRQLCPEHSIQRR